MGIESADGILELAEQAAPERTQLFAFGVGYDVDTILLDALAEAFVGSSHYVTPEERIDSEVARLYEQVSTPVLSDVEVSIDGVETSDLAPAGLPGIFAGDQALLTGRYTEPGEATVTVTGTSAEGPVTFVYDVTFPERATDDPAIAQLWAQRRVADLLTELRLEGQRDSLIEEIVDIATQFGIVTPYTAYLAEEPEMALADRGVRLDALSEVATDTAAAPAAGQEAVERAKAIGDLYSNDLAASSTTGDQPVQTLGSHAFYLVDGHLDPRRLRGRHRGTRGRGRLEPVPGPHRRGPGAGGGGRARRARRHRGTGRLAHAGLAEGRRERVATMPRGRRRGPESAAWPNAGAWPEPPPASSCRARRADVQYGSGMKFCSSMGGRT